MFCFCLKYPLIISDELNLLSFNNHTNLTNQDQGQVQQLIAKLVCFSCLLGALVQG